jgi:hypothetical protein
MPTRPLSRLPLLGPDQLSRIRSILVRDFEKNSEENGYLLGQIARRYEDGDAAHVADALRPPQLSELSGAAIQKAAQRYLDTDNYVRVTLMPEAK